MFSKIYDFNFGGNQQNQNVKAVYKLLPGQIIIVKCTIYFRTGTFENKVYKLFFIKLSYT